MSEVEVLDAATQASPNVQPERFLAALQAPSAASLAKQTEDVLREAANIAITSPVMFDIAGSELKSLKAAAKEIEGREERIKRPLMVALEEVRALFRPAKEGYAKAINIVNTAMVTYSAEQRRIAEERQRAADEAAAEERRKLEAAAAAARTEAAAREREAQALAQAGDAEAAAAAKQQAEAIAVAAAAAAEEAAIVTAPVVAPTTPKVAGLSERGTWSAEVTDKRAFIQWVAANIDSIGVIDMVDVVMPKLNTMARDRKTSGQIVPGVVGKFKATMAAR